MQARLLGAAGACLIVVVLTAIADHRRNRRANLDAVGVMPWATIQFAAIMAALLLVGVALRG